MKPQAISVNDFKLRIFLDTNVLVEYFENLTVNPSKAFIAAASQNENIDLVSSDYVIWELLNLVRNETCVKELVSKGLCSKRALRYPLGEDPKLRDKVAEEFDRHLSELQEGLNIQIGSLMDDGSDHFFEIVKKLFISSKIESQDILVIASALAMFAQKFLTKDSPLTDEGKRVTMLKDFIGKFPLPKGIDKPVIDFISPVIDGSPEKSIRRLFKTWFFEFTQNVTFGKVIEVFVEKNVVYIECVNDYLISERDSLCLFKFDDDANFQKAVFRVSDNNLWDAEKDIPVKEGKKVTVKLPVDVKCESWMKESSVVCVEG